MSSHSNAAWLPVTSRPPHDPRSLPLNERVGWHLASSENIEQNPCGKLCLVLQPGSIRSPAEASGSFAGLQLPKYLAYTADCGLLLLDREQSLLKKFDPCECRFDTVPCTGGHGDSIREFDRPAAIAICGDNLLVADRGNRRLMVYSLLGFLVRGIWSPPKDSISRPWQPVDVAVSRDRKVLVADPANGCIHVFNFAGRWLKAISGVGAVSIIAIDADNRLYVVVDAMLPPSIFQLPEGDRLNESFELAQLRHRFEYPGFEIDAEGRFDLGWLCHLYQYGCIEDAQPAWFDAGGNRIVDLLPAESKYFASGSAISEALDSRLYRCQWDRVAVKAAVPRGTRVKISTFSAETELTARQIAGLDDSQWLTRQWIYSQADGAEQALDWDCLIRSDEGRFLWLQVEMQSDTMATPVICEIQLDYPRISLARFLPAVFAEEPRAADFTDRFLAVFDRGFRQIEHQIDYLAGLFDPLSTPAGSGKKDFLSWLASWIGVTVDRQLPLSTRRRLVKNAGQLYQCRGTSPGLHNMLDLYLGFEARSCQAGEDCRPCHTKPAYRWQAPQLLLEHYVLRRWLFVGCARLGERAQLWGQKIVNRSQLSGEQTDGNAQLGVSQLNTRQDPLRDPFHVYAHKFSIFLPAWVGRIASFRNAMQRLVEAEKPAHTQAQIIYVEPRFRIGIQSMIGFDSVIGCYPQGVTLDESLLGKASVLSEQDFADSSLRIGYKSTIGTTTRLH
ncbi:MAG: hypothetical protein GY916_06925 [Gammaproteobacteria bacterium]|nr:hypothetical protein [Gammaproteobacteria bacterium]